MPPTETKLVYYFLTQLNSIPGSYFWRANTGAARTRTSFVRFGVVGQADILGVFKGQFIAVEVKKPGEYQTPEQRTFQANIIRAGGIYEVARTIEDIERMMRHHFCIDFKRK